MYLHSGTVTKNAVYERAPSFLLKPTDERSEEKTTFGTIQFGKIQMSGNASNGSFVIKFGHF